MLVESATPCVELEGKIADALYCWSAYISRVSSSGSLKLKRDLSVLRERRGRRAAGKAADVIQSSGQHAEDNERCLRILPPMERNSQPLYLSTKCQKS